MAVRLSCSLCNGCRTMRLLHTVIRPQCAILPPRAYTIRHLSNTSDSTDQVETSPQRLHGDSGKEHEPVNSSTDHDLATLLKNIQKPKESMEHLDSVPHKGTGQRTSSMSVEEVVEFLKEENARDVCVIHIPPEKDYVKYFITCTGMGIRHVGRIADNLAAELKHLRLGSGNRKVAVEGRDSEDWMAVDMGATVVHLMTEEGRRQYELEKLWTLGPNYDDQCRTMLQMYNTMTERKLFQ